MKIRKDLKHIASGERIAGVLGVSYSRARTVLASKSQKKVVKQAVIQDLIEKLEPFVQSLKDQKDVL